MISKIQCMEGGMVVEDIFLLDLDGTLCDVSHRKQLAKSKAWNEFHGLCHLDEPNPDVLRVVLLPSAPSCQSLSLVGMRVGGPRQRCGFFVMECLGKHYSCVQTGIFDKMQN